MADPAGGVWARCYPLLVAAWPHPREWTFPAQLPLGWTRRVGARDTPDPHMHIYLDGSGGTYSSDPRLRKCGWAWVQYIGPTAWGQYGALGGVQTVPRAEFHAFMSFLQFLDKNGWQDFVSLAKKCFCRCLRYCPLWANRQPLLPSILGWEISNS